MTSQLFFNICMLAGGSIGVVLGIFAGDEVIRIKKELSTLRNTLLAKKLGEWRQVANGGQIFVVTGTCHVDDSQK